MVEAVHYPDAEEVMNMHEEVREVGDVVKEEKWIESNTNIVDTGIGSEGKR